MVNKDNKKYYNTESTKIYKMFFFVSIIDIFAQRERQERVHEIFLFYFTVYIHYAYCQFWLHNKQSQLLCLPKLFYLVIIMVHNTQKLVFSLYREQNNLRVAAILWCIFFVRYLDTVTANSIFSNINLNVVVEIKETFRYIKLKYV